MGDPVGPPDAQRELVWRFRELADRHGGRPCFYGVPRSSSRCTSNWASTLQARRGGARAARTFTLDGAERRRLRTRAAARAGRLPSRSCRRAARAAPARAAPRLRRVARRQGTREKGFSLGCFDERYLRARARRPGAARRAARRLRQPLGGGDRRGAVGRPDAPRAGRARRADGLPLRAADALGRAEGYAGSTSAWRRSRASGPSARAAGGRASARCSTGTASTSTTSRDCASTRRSSAGVAPALPRVPGRAGATGRRREHTALVSGGLDGVVRK